MAHWLTHNVYRIRTVYLHSSWNSFGAKKDRPWKYLAKSFPKTCRLILATSWLSSNRAWKTTPGVCDIHRRTWYTVMRYVRRTMMSITGTRYIVRLMPKKQYLWSKCEKKIQFFLPHAFETHAPPYASISGTVLCRKLGKVQLVLAPCLSSWPPRWLLYYFYYLLKLSHVRSTWYHLSSLWCIVRYSAAYYSSTRAVIGQFFPCVQNSQY